MNVADVNDLVQILGVPGALIMFTVLFLSRSGWFKTRLRDYSTEDVKGMKSDVEELKGMKTDMDKIRDDITKIKTDLAYIKGRYDGKRG